MSPKEQIAQGVKANPGISSTGLADDLNIHVADLQASVYEMNNIHVVGSKLFPSLVSAYDNILLS